jgi:hypothetical protein
MCSPFPAHVLATPTTYAPQNQSEVTLVRHAHLSGTATILLGLVFFHSKSGLQVPGESVRVTSGPVYRAPDGTRSILRRIGRAIDSVGTVRVRRHREYLSIVETRDDATGCAGPHSVEHTLRADTLTVTTFDNLPQLCPQAYTPASYEVRVYGLRPGSYFVRYFTEGRGGRRSVQLLGRRVRLPLRAPLLPN